MPKVEPIDRIRQRFHREWLLIAVKEMDEATTTPLTGRLLAHSPHRDEVHRKAQQTRRLTYLTCTPDLLPKDVAIIFDVHIPA